MNLIYKEDESGSVSGYLARSDIDIQLYIRLDNSLPPAPENNKTALIILRSK